MIIGSDTSIEVVAICYLGRHVECECQSRCSCDNHDWNKFRQLSFSMANGCLQLKGDDVQHVP